MQVPGYLVQTNTLYLELPPTRWGSSALASVTALCGLNPDSFGTGLEGEDPEHLQEGGQAHAYHFPSDQWAHFTWSGLREGLEDGWGSGLPAMLNNR